MVLLASKCFKKNVVTKKGNLGFFVNLVFDKEVYEARMVVFPSIKDLKKKMGILSTISSIGASAVSSASYDLSQYVSQPVSSALSDAVYKGTSKLDQEKYEKVSKAAYQYYLVPVSEIDNETESEIKVGKEVEEYEIYLGMRGTESDLVFFNDEMYKDPELYVNISLNLPPVRGLSLKDVEGKRGRILDCVFDPNQGTMTYLVVATIEKGAQPRYIPLDCVDLSGMTVQKPFKECPTQL